MSLLRLRVPSRSEHVGEMRGAIAGMLCGLPLSDEARADILLAVGEACNNAIIHGKAEREDDALEVVCRVASNTGRRPRRLEIDVQNPGNGFHPGRDTAVFAMPKAEDFTDHGRGLPLMRILMDDVQVLSVNGNTIVRLTKDLG